MKGLRGGDLGDKATSQGERERATSRRRTEQPREKEDRDMCRKGSDCSSTRSGAGRSENLDEDLLQPGIYDVDRSRRGDMRSSGEMQV